MSFNFGNKGPSAMSLISPQKKGYLMKKGNIIKTCKLFSIFFHFLDVKMAHSFSILFKF